LTFVVVCRSTIRTALRLVKIVDVDDDFRSRRGEEPKILEMSVTAKLGLNAGIG